MINFIGYVFLWCIFVILGENIMGKFKFFIVYIILFIFIVLVVVMIWIVLVGKY